MSGIDSRQCPVRGHGGGKEQRRDLVQDAVRARDKRLRLRKQTLDWVGFPPIKHPVPSGPICPVPCPLSRGLGQRKDQLNLRLGFASIRAPILGPVSTIFDTPNGCQTALPSMQNTHPATTLQPTPIILYVHLVKSTDGREINGRLHASAVLEQDHSQ